MDNRYLLISLLIIAGVTALLRFLPFLLFRGDRKTPPFIVYLGRVLPYAIMTMLVVFCLKGMSFRSLSGFLPELISVAAVVLLHLWRKNTLLSIAAGTLIYMLLVQLVF